ncbi:protein kinase domain-containing protein [Streptomyces sp. CA-249302]|uniref:serine/threonine-protein kinase n=1 Tax=Streptomyces sp. CA-249302 TaxID=3240058 RepID=UPI003D8D02E2
MEALRANDPRRIGPYEVLGRLGAGGMGEVYLAEGRGGLRLAVKVVRAEHAEDRTFRARFRQEVRAAQTIGGAGTYTARVVDADTEAERPWMATEFVEGPNLRDAVLDHGALPEEAVRLLGAALGEALSAIHAKGMVHRDLKPSNILLSPDGPRVIDFGIVRALEATALTNTGAVVGSVGYVSPEQIRNGAEVGPPSDVFSLGAVLAYAAAGREPFGEGQDSVILLRILTRDFDLSGVPDALRPLVESCLAEDPATRLAPAGLPAAVGHTADSLGRGLRAGWYLPPADPAPSIGDTERWLPERDSGERESRVEYVAPMTVTEVTDLPDVPDVTADTGAPIAERPSRRGMLRVLVGGAVVAAGAGTGGWLWLRDRGGEDPSGSGDGVPGTSVSSDRSAGATLPAGVSWTYDVGGLGGRAGGRHGACVAVSPAGDRLYVGGADGSLHALTPAGKKLWAVDLGGPVMPPVATADGAYCLLEDGGEGASKLCAVAPDGRVRWTKKIDGGGSQFPVVAGDFVLVTTGATSEEGGVRAYSSGGGVVWERRTDGAPTSEPTVGNGLVHVGTFGNFVQALGLMDGNLRWSAPAGIDPGRPTLVGSTLMVGSGGTEALHGISTGGKVLWSVENDDAGGGRYFTSVRLGGLAVTTDQGSLAAIDPATGKTRWVFDAPQGGADHSDPTVVGSSVYVCLDGALHVVDANGKQRRKLPFADPEPDGGVHSPVIKGSRAYVATAKGIAALEL